MLSEIVNGCKILDMEVILPAQHIQIRPLRSRKDIAAIADLIDLCFADHMDMDGREYIRQLRRFTVPDEGITGKLLDSLHLPVQGLVWEENGRIVGNLSLITMSREGRRYSLIANVATHPDYRRRGIARELTLTGLQHIQQRGGREAWLHVRDDNPAAIQLYRSIGFEELCRRTQWLWEPGQQRGSVKPPAEVSITARKWRDWQTQLRWLKRIYPAEVSWNLSLDINRIKPHVWREFLLWLNGGQIAHIAARWRDQLIGLATWQPSYSYADTLWLATDPDHEHRAVAALLSAFNRRIQPTRPLSVNYPAGNGEEGFRAAGFYPQLTLIWMKMAL